MAAGQKRDEGLVDHFLLAEDDRVDRVSGAPDSLKRGLRVPDDGIVQGGGRLSYAGRHEFSPLINISPQS
ncbi:hypothetical protein MAE02_32110 [Microvirga aerophila]|uniref:Uncharacterized protein n=1 Tax=Microvirga aerophila TaxID=670291 RepID=A0A512BUC1_9HYPH|nr:hypothetical protein MAE02_32110 [Microvirga aerophila]